VAIIRVRVEGARRDRLVVQITTVDDVMQTVRRIAAAASVEDTLTIVQGWMRGIVEARDRGASVTPDEPHESAGRAAD
jgi:hypothetical protein